MTIAKELLLPNRSSKDTINHKGKVVPFSYVNSKISDWHQKTHLKLVKRTVDVVGSVAILTVSSPIFVVLAVMVKATSKGPLFYAQERVGRGRKPFHLYKFRSMHHNAEKGHPVCAQKNDPRITPIGGWMRKTHLDELPNLFNVLRGDMSLVGPRPERQYFINKIIVKAPQFNDLLMIKPGVTSWGQVEFGYAQHVDEMVKRMIFDLKYLHNCSLKTDFIILSKTFTTVIKGKGV